MEGHDAHGDEGDEEHDREVLDLAVGELRAQLNHRNLPGEAADPDKGEDDRDPVQLVMNQLVVLVYLEYESVVDVVAAEDLDGKPSSEQYEANDRSEVVGVHAGVQLIPERIWSIDRDRTDDEEDEEGDQDEDAASKEADQV